MIAIVQITAQICKCSLVTRVGALLFFSQFQATDRYMPNICRQIIHSNGKFADSDGLPQTGQAMSFARPIG
jgi:hypothetical protein